MSHTAPYACTPPLLPSFLRPSFLRQRLHCRFPASSRPDIFAAQHTLLEAWSIVGHNFVDQSFAGRNWDEELGSALMSAYDAPTSDMAYDAINDLLGLLKDPYTRLVRSK